MKQEELAQRLLDGGDTRTHLKDFFRENSRGFRQRLRADPLYYILKAHRLIMSVIWGTLKYLGLTYIFVWRVFPVVGAEKTTIFILLLIVVILMQGRRGER